MQGDKSEINLIFYFTQEKTCVSRLTMAHRFDTIPNHRDKVIINHILL